MNKKNIFYDHFMILSVPEVLGSEAVAVVSIFTSSFFNSE